MGNWGQEPEGDQGHSRPRSCGGRVLKKLKREGVNNANMSKLLEIVPKEEDPHIIFVTETKLNTDDITSTYFDINPYTV